MVRFVHLLYIALLICPVWSNDTFQQTLVLELAKVLLDNYCYPENLDGMQEAIHEAIIRGENLQVSDPKTLASILTAGVQGALSDPRLVISYDSLGLKSAPSTPQQPLTPQQLLALTQHSVKYDVFEGNIGYLRADHIIGEDVVQSIGPTLVGNIWKALQNTSSLILDLRYSSSGHISGVSYLVSYFWDENSVILIDSIYDRPSNTTKLLWTLPVLLGQRYSKDKDVIVLISRYTEGVAEDVAYILKHLKRVITVGERTAGGSLKIEKIRIGQSNFYITVPVARSINPVTKQSWEVSGVFPTVVVREEKAIQQAKVIIGIRRTIPKIVHSLSSLLNEYYVFSERVPAIVDQLSITDYSSVTSEESVASKINSALQLASEDPRLMLKVLTEPSVILQGNAKTTPQLPDNPEFLQALVQAIFKVDVFANNIGYIRFDEFCDVSTLVKLGQYVVDHVWNRVKDTQSLILDFRYNVGGPSPSVPRLLSYFQDPETVVLLFSTYNKLFNTTQEYHSYTSRLLGIPYGSRRGVYVLTSHLTSSAAEEFTFVMQTMNRATVIGEITSGTLLHSRTFQVEGTNLAFTIPVINFIDSNGEYWLGGGVVPDFIVLAEAALEKAKEMISFHSEISDLIINVGDLLEVHYANPDIASKVSKVLKSKVSEGAYVSVVDYESFASQLTSILQETSGDHHLLVFYSDSEPELQEDVSSKIPPADQLEQVIQALFKTEVLPGNLGYLRFDLMADVEVIQVIAPRLITMVWNNIVSTDALIIDLRFNTGEYSNTIPILCSYFFDEEPARHLYSVFDRESSSVVEIWTAAKLLGQRYGSKKDVFILTSHMTGTAVEIFTRAMKDLKRATVIGEPTVGGSLSVGTYRIGESNLYLSVPNQVALSAVSGKVWGGSGVEPHLIVQAKDALDVAISILKLRSNIPSVLQTIGSLVSSKYGFEVLGAEIDTRLTNLIDEDDYNLINSEIDLAKRLTTDLYKMSGDSCLKVLHVPDPSTGHISGAVPIQIPSPDMYEEFVKFSFVTDVFEDNIGYLRFDVFGGQELLREITSLLVKHVWNKIAETDGLILDFRYNIGGPMSAVATLCSYFFNSGQHILLDKIYNRSSNSLTEMWTLPQLAGEPYGSQKPLIVLTSEVTTGAAEEFVYIMKRLGRAMIIGEKTSGGCHFPQTYRIDNTNLYLSVPEERSVSSTDGTSWEGIGVYPHIEVPAPSAINKAKEILQSYLQEKV